MICEAGKLDILGIPVLFIAAEVQFAVVDPGIKPEGAAGGYGPGLAAVAVPIGRYIALAAGKDIHCREEGRVRIVKCDDQRVIILCRHADLRGIALTVVGVLEIDDAEEVAGEAPGVLRVCLPPEGIGIVLRAYLLSVLPVILPQVEGVPEAVVTDVPSLCSGWRNLSVLNPGQGFRNGMKDHPVNDPQKPGAVQGRGIRSDKRIDVLLRIPISIVNRSLAQVICAALDTGGF